MMHKLIGLLECIVCYQSLERTIIFLGKYNNFILLNDIVAMGNQDIGRVMDVNLWKTNQMMTHQSANVTILPTSQF